MQGKRSDPFILKNSSEDFLQRQNDVFGQLSTLKCNLHKDKEMHIDETSRRRNGLYRSSTKHLRGKESIFKVPELPSTYIRTMPDFKKNPHKWTKYSLENVKDEDMSESSNTRAALSFLNDLKKRSADEMETDEPQKIVFKKTCTERKSVQDLEESTDKPTFRSSKVVMPEYEVGKKVKKEKKKTEKVEVKSKQLKLEHLFEDED